MMPGSFEPDTATDSMNYSTKRVVVEGEDGAPVKALLDWAREHGARFEKLEFSVSPSCRGLGAIARLPISSGEIIASIPARLAMSIEVARVSPQGLLLSECPDHTVMMAFLIAQKAADDSFYHAYASSLPMVLDSPLFWSEVERKELLAGTNLLAAVCEVINREFEAYSKFIKPMIDEHPVEFPPEVYTWESWMWAHGILRSRGFPGRVGGSSSTILLPVLDILNHRACTSIEWKLISSNTSTMLGEGEGESSTARFEHQKISDHWEVQFIAGARYEAVDVGYEVFNNYGAKGCEELLLSYGFVEPGNPAELARLSLPLMEMTPLQREYFAAKDPSILPRHEFTLFLHDENVPQDLVSAIRVLSCSRLDMYTRLYPFLARRLHFAQDGLMPFISYENEMDMYSTLEEMLKMRIEMLLRSSPQASLAGRRAELAKTHRELQRAVLDSVLARVQRSRVELVRSAEHSFDICITSNGALSSSSNDNGFISWVREHGDCHLEFDAHGVFAFCDVECGQPLLKLPPCCLISSSQFQIEAMASTMLSPISHGNPDADSEVDDSEASELIDIQIERLMIDAVISHPYIGSQVDWSSDSPLLWPDDEVVKLGDSLAMRVGDRLADETDTTSNSMSRRRAKAIIDAHTVRCGRAQVLVPVPRMPDHSDSACTLWEWRGESLCLVCYHPNGVKAGSRIVARLDRGLTDEDILMRAPFTFAFGSGADFSGSQHTIFDAALNRQDNIELNASLPFDSLVAHMIAPASIPVLACSYDLNEIRSLISGMLSSLPSHSPVSPQHTSVQHVLRRNQIIQRVLSRRRVLLLASLRCCDQLETFRVESALSSNVSL